MKKKIYLMSYAVIQGILSVLFIVFAEQVAKKQVASLLESAASFPVEMQNMMKEMYTVESMKASIILTAIAGIILAIILGIIFAKNKVGEKKTLAIILTVVSMVIFGDMLIILLGAIALVVIAKTPKSLPFDKDGKVVTEKKKLVKLEKLEETSKDIILAVVLIFAYLSQFIIGKFVTSPTPRLIMAISYYVILFILGWWVFRKRLKRDFKAYKSEVGLHVSQTFKWWGILLLLSFGASFLRLILGGAVQTANQTALNNSALWYTIPLAILWAPLVEEVVFRGCIRRFIKNDVAFVIVSSIAFGMIHTIGLEDGLYNMIVQSLQYAAMGVAMSLAYVKTNNICINMGVHCIQNTFSSIFMLFM